MVFCTPDDDFIMINEENGEILHKIFVDDLGMIVEAYHKKEISNWAFRKLMNKSENFADIKSNRAADLFMEIVGSQEFEDYCGKILDKCVEIVVKTVDAELEFINQNGGEM